MWKVLLLLSVFSINQVLAQSRRGECLDIEWSEAVNVTSTEVTVRWRCCNSRLAPSYRLQMKSRFNQTNCSCDLKKDQVTNECVHTFSNLCPHTNYQLTVKNIRIAESSYSGRFSGDQFKENPVTINLKTHISNAPYFTKPSMMELKLIARSSGTTVTLKCPAQGNPIPTTTWRKGSGPPKRKLYKPLHYGKFSLTMEMLSTSDSGKYTCIVSNSEGSINWTYTLEVQDRLQHKPIIRDGFPANQTVNVGQQVKFECRFISDLQPTIKWIKWLSENVTYVKDSPVPNITIIQSTNPNITDPTFLILDNVTFEDAGWYSCLAANYLGTVVKNVYLTVLPSPRNMTITEAKAINDTAVNLNWDHDCPNGKVMYNVTWSPDDGAFLTEELELTVVHLKPATMYTFVINACNIINSSMCESSTALVKTLPGEPSAPTTFEAVDVSSTAVHFQWNHPEDPNGPIDGYEIVCRPETNANFKTITTLINKTEEFLVTGLEPWTIYSCSVLAYNFQDFNKMTGNQSTLTTLTKPAPPDQPPNLEIVDKTSDGFFLKWNRPYVPRGPIDGYVVRTSNGKIEIENKTSSEQFRLSGLSTWTQYNITVHAFNIDGNDTLNGKVSTISVKTRPAAPTAPRDVRVINTISGETYLKWKRPLTPNGEIHGYYVKNVNDESEDIVSGSVLKFHLNDLSPDTNYTFSVYAYNVDGMERLDGTESSVNHTTKSQEPPVFEMVNELRKDMFREFSKTHTLIRKILRNFGEESDGSDQKHETTRKP